MVKNTGKASDTSLDNPVYTFHDVSTTWEDAKAKCEENGAHLVTLETTKEWNCLVEIIKEKVKKCKNPTDLLIGLRKGVDGDWKGTIDKETSIVELITEKEKPSNFTHWYIGLRKENGNWQWRGAVESGNSGGSVTNEDSRWQPHEPSDTTGEECGEINSEYPAGVYGHFNNVKCNFLYSLKNPRGYICEKS